MGIDRCPAGNHVLRWLGDCLDAWLSRPVVQRNMTDDTGTKTNDGVEFEKFSLDELGVSSEKGLLLCSCTMN